MSTMPAFIKTGGLGELSIPTRDQSNAAVRRSTNYLAKRPWMSSPLTVSPTRASDQILPFTEVQETETQQLLAATFIASTLANDSVADALIDLDKALGLTAAPAEYLLLDMIQDWPTISNAIRQNDCSRVTANELRADIYRRTIFKNTLDAPNSTVSYTRSSQQGMRTLRLAFLLSVDDARSSDSCTAMSHGY
jgi:hypothetical protein